MENGPGFGVAGAVGAAEGDAEAAGVDGEGAGLPLVVASATEAVGVAGGPPFATRPSSATPVMNSVAAARVTTIVAAAIDPIRRTMELRWRC
jgi:hypothetical protein